MYLCNVLTYKTSSGKHKQVIYTEKIVQFRCAGSLSFSCVCSSDTHAVHLLRSQISTHECDGCSLRVGHTVLYDWETVSTAVHVTWSAQGLI